MDQDARWKVGLDPSDIELDGNPAPLPQKGRAASQISADVCCDQTAGWINMPLGTKVGLDPGRIMLHGDLAPPP